MSEMCCTRLAENAGPKNRQKFAIWAPSDNFVGLYLRNSGMYRPSKKIVKQQYLPHVPYNLVNFGLAAEIVSLVWGTPHGTLVVGVDETLRR